MRYDGGMTYEERIRRVAEEADLDPVYVRMALDEDWGWPQQMRKLLNYADSLLRSFEDREDA